LVSIRGELSAKIEAVESRLGSKIEVLKSEVRSGFSALDAKLENAVLRGELSTTREIADLREIGKGTRPTCVQLKGWCVQWE